MKIGDKVRVKNKGTNPYGGSEGIIVGNEKNDSCYKQQRYWVSIKDVLGDRWFCYDELEVIK